MPLSFESRSFFRRTCTRTKPYPNRTEYTITCPDGMGLVTCREVFPGVELSVNDFHACRCVECYEPETLFQMDFCCAGRFECAFSGQERCILNPGDLVIHRCMERRDTEATFPAGYYQGVNLTIDLPRAEEHAARQFGPLAPDFQRLPDHLMGGHWFRVGRTEAQCASILQGLLTLEEDAPPQLLCLKLLELFCLLEAVPPETSPSTYLPRAQIELAKRVHDRLTNCPEDYSSEKQLAWEHQISVSQLQKIFKQLYGISIYQYVRQCRLERAETALRETDRPVTEIALDAGFVNPGKFAESFRKRNGLTPSQFRAAQKWNIEMEQPR